MRVGRAIVRFGGTSLGARLAGPLDTVAGLLRNDTGDGTVNGEDRLLRELAALDPSVVVDAGANHGEWSLAAARCFPRARVLAFEPVGPTFSALAAATAAEPRVEALRCALSNRDGDAAMWVDDTVAGAMSSMVASPHHGAVEVVVPCRRGAGVLAERGLERVDVLKVDTEGHELEVLEGFGTTLSEQRIEVVQFEHTRWAVPARRWVADYERLFADHGYVMGRLLQRRIDWSPYSIYDEGFRRSHFVAVPRGGRAAGLLGAPT